MKIRASRNVVEADIFASFADPQIANS